MLLLYQWIMKECLSFSLNIREHGDFSNLSDNVKTMIYSDLKLKLKPMISCFQVEAQTNRDFGYNLMFRIIPAPVSDKNEIHSLLDSDIFGSIQKINFLWPTLFIYVKQKF